ncbi:Agamous-like MADS-box protein AGL80 [Linum perenne]
MGRQRLRVRWIVDDEARRTTFRRKRLSLIKKVSELTTLCGIEGTCVIYSQGDTSRTASKAFRAPVMQPEPPLVWPSEEVAAELMERFLALPGVERSKKMTNQQGYLQDAIQKAQEQKSQILNKIWDMELTLLMDQVKYGKGIKSLNMEQLKRLSWLLEVKVHQIRKRVELISAGKQVDLVCFPPARSNGRKRKRAAGAGTADCPIYIDENGSGEGSEVNPFPELVILDDDDDVDVDLNLGIGGGRGGFRLRD